MILAYDCTCIVYRNGWTACWMRMPWSRVKTEILLTARSVTASWRYWLARSTPTLSQARKLGLSSLSHRAVNELCGARKRGWLPGTWKWMPAAVNSDPTFWRFSNGIRPNIVCFSAWKIFNSCGNEVFSVSEADGIYTIGTCVKIITSLCMCLSSLSPSLPLCAIS